MTLNNFMTMIHQALFSWSPTIVSVSRCMESGDVIYWLEDFYINSKSDVYFVTHNDTLAHLINAAFHSFLCTKSDETPREYTLIKQKYRKFIVQSPKVHHIVPCYYISKFAWMCGSLWKNNKTGTNNFPSNIYEFIWLVLTQTAANLLHLFDYQIDLFILINHQQK